MSVIATSVKVPADHRVCEPSRDMPVDPSSSDPKSFELFATFASTAESPLQLTPDPAQEGPESLLALYSPQHSL